MTKRRNWENPAVTAEWEAAKAVTIPTARDRAAAHIDSVRDIWSNTVPATWLLDAIPSDLLREVADERRMTGGRT
jgi:hypothetical protein